MGTKLFFISILLAIFLLGIGVYSAVNFSSRTISPNIQNNKLESVGSTPANTDNINKESDFSSLTNEDFVIKDENYYIELGGKNGDIKTKDKITEFIPANEHHAYQIYVFENFKITTTPLGEINSTISCIDLTTPVIKTSKGIKVGDTIDKVFEKYGEVKSYDTSDTTGYYRYNFEDKISVDKALGFFVNEKGEVTDIRYEFAV